MLKYALPLIGGVLLTAAWAGATGDVIALTGASPLQAAFQTAATGIGTSLSAAGGALEMGGQALLDLA